MQIWRNWQFGNSSPLSLRFEAASEKRGIRKAGNTTKTANLAKLMI